MPDLQLLIAIIIGKFLYHVAKIFPFYGGTALPGLIALKIDPQFIKKICQKNQLKSVIISGTNGKTTTARLLGSILKTNSTPFIHNRTGSNLLRGVASTLIQSLNLNACLNYHTAILEIDEAVVLKAVSQLNPQILVLNNLFRDQLDRYGEINTLLSLWQKAVKKLSPHSQLILNIDDPSLNYLAQKFKPAQNLIAYGLKAQYSQYKKPQHSADALFCPLCSQTLEFSAVFTGHLGHYSCPNCHFNRLKPNFKLDKITTLDLLPGIYNQYNILAAAAAAQALKINQTSIYQGLKTFKPAFGRTESFTLNNQSIHLYLVKNPAGFNAVLQTLINQSHFKSSPLLIAINDKIADGRDISWLWDVNFNLLKNRQTPIITAGLRSLDMSLRLKYTPVLKNKIITQPNLKLALNKILQKKSKNQHTYLLATYTAMLQIRKILTQKKLIHPTWKD